MLAMIAMTSGAACRSTPVSGPQTEPAEVEGKLENALGEYCGDCHFSGARDAPALEFAELGQHPKRLLPILLQVSSRDMPPPSEEPLSEVDRAALIRTLCEEVPSPQKCFSVFAPGIQTPMRRPREFIEKADAVKDVTPKTETWFQEHVGKNRTQTLDVTGALLQSLDIAARCAEQPKAQRKACVTRLSRFAIVRPVED